MVLSGAALPGALAALGSTAWPAAWLALGVASLICCPVALWAAHRIRDAGGIRWRPIASLAAAENVDARVPVRPMAPALLGYGLYAAGYIVYLTFLVAWMGVLDAGPVLVSLTWTLVGLGILASPFLWSGVLARRRGGMPLALATAATGLATLIPLIWPSAGGVLLSAAAFGLAVFIAPSAITAFSRKNLPCATRGRGIALFTTVFAAGQTIGPVAAGAIGDVFGSIGHGLAAAALILLVGAIVASAQRPLGGARSGPRGVET